MGSNPEEQLLRVLSQLEQDAGGLGQGQGTRKPPARPEPLTPRLPTDLSDDVDGVGPQALPEKHLLEGEKQPHGSGQGPYFYIGGTNGASM